MAAMKEVVCSCGCGRKKKVRVADINRGWGRYYSKSCKAKDQVKRLGQIGKTRLISIRNGSQTVEYYVRGFEKKPIFDDSRDW